MNPQRITPDYPNWQAVLRLILDAFAFMETRIELTENHATFARLGFVKTAETAHPGYDGPTSITMSRSIG